MGPRRKDQISSKRQTASTRPVDLGQQGLQGSMQRSDPSQLPVELQQLILDQFQHAFPFDSPADLKNVIQEVKGHLYNRDFITAFSSPTYLQAYALRWSASRALAYAHIFSELEVVRKWQEGTTVAAEVHMPSADVRDRAYSIICIGGGAGAELVTLASTLTTHPNMRIEATAIDIANWSDILTKLEGSMKRPLPLSKYASESARAANTAFIESSQLDAKFVQQDILACKDDELRGIWSGVSLCTIMFTLNELFTSSIAKTTTLLLKMTGMMQEGSFLLVVDSPGSYSEIKLGKDGQTKRYPMKWLMDHALLEVAGKDKWEKILDDDSRWFRLPSDLKYPIDLENMRYQIHLYRRLD